MASVGDVAAQRIHPDAWSVEVEQAVEMELFRFDMADLDLVSGHDHRPMEPAPRRLYLDQLLVARRRERTDVEAQTVAHRVTDMLDSCSQIVTPVVSQDPEGNTIDSTRVIRIGEAPSSGTPYRPGCCVVDSRRPT